MVSELPLSGLNDRMQRTALPLRSDQSYLEALIESCRQVLATYPIKGRLTATQTNRAFLNLIVRFEGWM